MPNPPRIVLLRGINVGATNRIAMASLRAALTEAGHGNVRTHLQSGNVVLESELDDVALAAAVGELIEARFGLEIPVLALTLGELREVVQANPLAELAERDPKRFQVTFLNGAPDADAVAEIAGLAQEHGERVAGCGRALYAWHPEGIHLSKAARLMTPRRLGVTQASARNWTTVQALLEMASA